MIHQSQNQTSLTTLRSYKQNTQQGLARRGNAAKDHCNKSQPSAMFSCYNTLIAGTEAVSNSDSLCSRIFRVNEHSRRRALFPLQSINGCGYK